MTPQSPHPQLLSPGQHNAMSGPLRSPHLNTQQQHMAMMNSPNPLVHTQQQPHPQQQQQSQMVMQQRSQQVGQ